MNRLADLHNEQGQSPWLDNLRRSWILDGHLAGLIDDGVRGITSNPSIFQKAISDDTAYDEQFARLVAEGRTIEEAYWDLVIDDIVAAADLLAGVHRDSDGADGFVSVEVSPRLARDTDATLDAARRLHQRIDRPNVMIKIPGTVEGLPAIEQMIAEGRPINVTLIFGLERYARVMEAYLSGLEANPGPLAPVASVASFFVSRVDVEVDRRLDEIDTDEARSLRGTAAIAQARLAYAQFRRTFSGPRWEALAARGARLQRPLWASTSTKDPSYPDTLYVDNLIGPDTVNTLPDATLEAFADHGVVARTVDADLDEARRTVERLAAVGIDLDEVAVLLEDQGVEAFARSFDDLLDTMSAEANPAGDG